MDGPPPPSQVFYQKTLETNRSSTANIIEGLQNLQQNLSHRERLEDNEIEDYSNFLKEYLIDYTTLDLQIKARRNMAFKRTTNSMIHSFTTRHLLGQMTAYTKAHTLDWAKDEPSKQDKKTHLQNKLLHVSMVILHEATSELAPNQQALSEMTQYVALNIPTVVAELYDQATTGHDNPHYHTQEHPTKPHGRQASPRWTSTPMPNLVDHDWKVDDRTIRRTIEAQMTTAPHREDINLLNTLLLTIAVMDNTAKEIKPAYKRYSQETLYLNTKTIQHSTLPGAKEFMAREPTALFPKGMGNAIDRLHQCKAQDRKPLLAKALSNHYSTGQSWATFKTCPEQNCQGNIKIQENNPAKSMAMHLVFCKGTTSKAKEDTNQEDNKDKRARTDTPRRSRTPPRRDNNRDNDRRDRGRDNNSRPWQTKDNGQKRKGFQNRGSNSYRGRKRPRNEN